MKTRQGFVSNSSSSSFLIVSKNKELPTIKVELEIPIERQIKTIKELKEYFDDYHEYDPDDPECAKHDYQGQTGKCYKEALEALNSGKFLYFCSTGSGDPLYSYMEQECIEPDEFKLPGCQVI